MSATPGSPSRGWGIADTALGVAMLVVIWGTLPARWWPVDVLGSAFALAQAAAGVGLLLRRPWGRIAALVTSAITLLAGLALCTALALTASYLAGIYGPVGRGGAVILVFVALLVVPYFIALPAVQVFAMRKPPVTQPPAASR